MVKPVHIGLVVALLWWMARKRFAQVLDVQVIRNDTMGLGHFGAPRRNRTHQGLDLVVEPGQPVRSPIAGRFIRTGRPYPDGPFRLVVVQGEGWDVRLMYVDPDPALVPGAPVKRGQVLGTAQDVRQRYGQAMKPHVHIEVRRVVGAQLLDPAPLLLS